MFENLKEKIEEMLKEKDVKLYTYAFVDWHPNAEKHNYKGAIWKRVWYIRSGAEHFEILPYNPEVLEMLKLKQVPIYDSTLGYDEPLSNIQPTDFEFIRLGSIKRPIYGIQVK